jgi:hypothetical protein
VELVIEVPPCDMIFDVDTILSREILNGYRCPGSPEVHRTDGGVVTVSDVLEQLLGYFKVSQDDLLKLKLYLFIRSMERRTELSLLGSNSNTKIQEHD